MSAYVTKVLVPTYATRVQHHGDYGKINGGLY